MNKNIFAVIIIILLLSLSVIPQGNSLTVSHQEHFNIKMNIYAFNLTFPAVWGVYGYFNYSYSGIEKFIPVSNISNNYIDNINISFNVNNSVNTTLKYNMSLFYYQIQGYRINNNPVFINGSLPVNTTLNYYNESLNSSYISFISENNFYYFFNTYGYQVIGTVVLLSLFIMFIIYLRRNR